MTTPTEEAQLLLRAVEIGDNLVTIADTLGEGIAANHIAAGLEILRVRAELALHLGQGVFDEGQSLG